MDHERARQLGAYIRDIRKARGLTIRALAAQAHIDSGGLARLEGAKIVRTPHPDTLRSLAVALNVSLADLFVLAGYAVPQDLPGIEPYLQTKYPALPEEDVFAISQEVEWLAQDYAAKQTTSSDSNERTKSQR